MTVTPVIVEPLLGYHPCSIGFLTSRRDPAVGQCLSLIHISVAGKYGKTGDCGSEKYLRRKKPHGGSVYYSGLQ